MGGEGEHRDDMLRRFTLGKPSKSVCVGVSMSLDLWLCVLGS